MGNCPPEKVYIYIYMSEKKCQQKYIYTNFDSSYSIRPCQVYYPRTIGEISQIVRSNPGKKIRVSASHHTFNDLSGSQEIK